MNSWTDILLVIAIVIGLISAASLPMVSVNAISSDALRLHEARREVPPPGLLMMEDDATRRRIGATWQEPSGPRGTPPAAARSDPD